VLKKEEQKVQLKEMGEGLKEEYVVMVGWNEGDDEERVLTKAYQTQL